MENQKNQPTYFQSEFQRKNLLRMWFYEVVVSICSYPRLILEVFIRSHMGERYCNTMSMVTVGALLFFLPWTPFFGNHQGDSLFSVVMSQKLWYAFVAAYAIFAVKRRKELKRDPSVFDFGKYSLSTGYVLPFFKRFTDSHGQVNFRLIEIWLEPLPILIIGFIISLTASPLGLLLMVCSIIYSLSYMATYAMGDEVIMGIIDKGIRNEEMEGVIVNGSGPETSRGFRSYGRRPGTVELRQRLLDNMNDKRRDDDDDNSSIAE